MLHANLDALTEENERLLAQVAHLTRFATIVEGTDQLIVEIDPQVYFTYVNPAAQRYLGCEPRACLGRLWFDFLHPDDREVARQLLARWMQEQLQTVTIQNRIVHRDGTPFHILWSMTLHYGDSGQIARITAIACDVGELHRVAEEFHSFKVLVELAPDGIAIADLQLNLVYANPALQAMLGYPNLIGMPVPSFVYPPDLEKLRAIADKIQRSQSLQQQVIRYMRYDGSLVTVQASAVALRDQQGNLTGYASINRDISDQIAAEETLRRSEQRHRDLLAAIPDLMFLLSPDGTFLDCKGDRNGKLLLPPEEFLGRRVVDVLPTPLADLVMSHLDALRRTGVMQTFTYQLLLDDEIEEYEARMSFSNNDVLVLSRNITEQRRVERERAAMQEQIIQAQQATLRELSTPLLPIANGVVVMPLVGAIDSTRAQQVMETLLYGVTEHNAHVVIIDITGVKVVDTQVAGALIRAAQASRMLGAQVVLTGIRPEIAQTLVHIRAELRDMTTKATLQDGIRYALNLSARTVKATRL
ncbi:MAG: PAS domain-containing protein [Chloroflexus sp.]